MIAARSHPLTAQTAGVTPLESAASREGIKDLGKNLQREVDRMKYFRFMSSFSFDFIGWARDILLHELHYFKRDTSQLYLQSRSMSVRDNNK